MIRLAVDCEAVVRQLRIAFRLASAADSPCNCHRRQRRRPDGGGVLPGRGCAAAGDERGADVAGYRQRLCRRGGKQGERAEQQRGSGWEVQTGARCPNLSTPYELSTGIRLGPRKHTRAPSPVRGKRILRQKKRVLRQKKRVLMIECLSSPLERRIPGVPAATGRDRLPPGHPQRCHPLLSAHGPALRARFDGAHLEPGLRALGRDHDHRPGPLGSPGGGSAPGVARFRMRASRFAIDSLGSAAPSGPVAKECSNSHAGVPSCH